MNSCVQLSSGATSSLDQYTDLNLEPSEALLIQHFQHGYQPWPDLVTNSQ